MHLFCAIIHTKKIKTWIYTGLGKQTQISGYISYVVDTEWWPEGDG